eukprot:COSAG01_NODE_9265_length_2499_cov_9.194583_3_plen_200_part_00
MFRHVALSVAAIGLRRRRPRRARKTQTPKAARRRMAAAEAEAARGAERQGDRNRIRWLAVVRTHLGHLSDPAEIVGFGCTRIAAGRQAEIYWDLRWKWPQICRNSAEPAGKTYAHTHLGAAPWWSPVAARARSREPPRRASPGATCAPRAAPAWPALPPPAPGGGVPEQLGAAPSLAPGAVFCPPCAVSLERGHAAPVR